MEIGSAQMHVHLLVDDTVIARGFHKNPTTLLLS